MNFALVSNMRKTVEEPAQEFLKYSRQLTMTLRIPKRLFKTLDSKLKNEKFKEPNEVYRFVKSSKYEEITKLFIKAKEI